jgi:hypothetical protein
MGLACQRERRERRGAPGGLAGPGEEKTEQTGPGCAGEKEGEEKEKERVGRAQREKEGEKEFHSNAFEFEFKI